MGGIKNKLKQLSNKVANLVFSARLGSSVRRSLLDGVDNKTFNLASTARGGGLRSKPVGLLSITKYASIACFTLALISTIGLNLYRTYSSSNVRTNAVDGSTNSELAAQANIDPASISLSITSSPSSSTGGNNPNLSLSIPQGGGIATGRHTVTISVGSDVQEYRARFSSKTEETALVNESNSNTKIPAIDTFYVDGDGSTEDLERVLAATPGNLWAYSYEEHGNAPAITTARVDALPPASSPDIFQYDLDAVGTSSTDINYGVKVEHPESMPAGNYVANIVYTATVEQLRQPILTSVTPNTYELGSGADNTITITGKYLSTASKAYLVHASTGEQYYCTDLQLVNTDASGNTTLTCNVPTDQTDPNIEPDTYGVYVLTNAGETAYTDAATFTYTKPSICRNADPDSDCQVDIDDNMIPVVYEGYDGNGGGYWAVVSDADIQNNPGSWYNYRSGQWANAVTVQSPSKYTNAATGTEVDNNDVLGYWVYIPRYAYEVQRRDAVDRVVDPQNFDIVFQTADEKNTPASTCNSADSVWVDSTPTSGATSSNSNILSKDYRTGCWPNNRTYIANSSNTTWATHPAFSWGTEETGYTELNGIWVGKFETTGTRTAPTVKPNQHANISEYIGEFYSAARSIGYPDPNNVGGGARTDDTTSGLTQNSHHLAKATSHMLKNSEWGAITYLAHSKYGAGINTSYTRKSNVSKNGAYPSSSADADGTSSRYGITGCGPVSAGSTSYYDEGTPLSADVIESTTACSTDITKAYNGSTGVLASTTNTIYGIYDTAGGASEYVMGNKTTSDTQSGGSTRCMKTPAQPPYVDLYKSSSGFDTKPSWSSDSLVYRYNYDVCTFETCGGTATHETTTVQSVSSDIQSWGGTLSNFVYSSHPWFYRGSNSIDSYASPFHTDNYDGIVSTSYGSRAALLALPAGQ